MIILVIFWFAACYSILQAKGQLKLADDERTKAIILLRERHVDSGKLKRCV